MRQVHTAVLPNGLKILGEVIPTAHSASIGFFVRTGARDETAPESGVSHFLEHMMFKGTKKRSALDITYELGNLAAQSNAFTSEEMTVYYASVIPEYFASIQELLSDMLRPALDPAEYDMEKKVILEEIALYQDRPHFYLYENALEAFFGQHPAGKSVLGTTASVGALTRDQMQAYFDRRYAPSNITLVGAGKFEWGEFLDRAGEYCKGWKDFKATREKPEFHPTPITKEFRKAKIQQAHVLLMAGGVSAQDEARFAAAVLATILGDSSGSKLYWALVDSGICESAGADSDDRDGAGVFLASASMQPERIDEVSKIIRGIFSSAMDFTDAELAQAKTKLKTKVVFGGELPMGRMMALGQEWLYRERLHSLSEVMSRIADVSRGDIDKVLKRFPIGNPSEFRLVPG